MSSSFFNFKSPAVKKGYCVLVAIFFFFLFDRLLFLSLRETMFGFYRMNPFEKDVFDRIKFLKKDFYDTIIMGTSRTEYGIHPIYLYKELGIKAINFARKGRYPRFFYEFYRLYHQKYGKPRFIIYGTDYFMFKRKTDEAQLTGLTGGQEGQVKRLNPSTISNRRSWWLNRFSLLFRVKNHLDVFFTDVIDYASFRLANRRHRGQSDIPPGVSTFRGWPGKIETRKSLSSQNSKTMPFAPFPGEEGEYFLKLLDLCHRDHVKVILVSLPDYIQTSRTNFEQGKYRAELEKIAARYVNVQFWDFNSPGKFPLDNPQYFLDGGPGAWNSHLSIYGAYFFNQVLCRRLKDYRRQLQESQLN